MDVFNVHREKREKTHTPKPEKVEETIQVKKNEVHASEIRPIYLTRNQVASDEIMLNRAIKVIYYFAAVGVILIGVRFIFHLLGVRSFGFVNFIYFITEPFVDPFRGSLSAPAVSGVEFEVESLVAILAIVVLSFFGAGFLKIMSRDPKT